MQTVTFMAVLGEDRVIRLPPEVMVPPGEVQVTVTQPAQRSNEEPSPRALIQRLAGLAQKLGIDDIPADMAENHDYYAHGAPKGIDRS